jgi:hypothetical protein
MRSTSTPSLALLYRTRLADLKKLEKTLSALSHSEHALSAIQSFSEGLKYTSDRLAVFNADRALVRPPISNQEANAFGFDREDDSFTLLQGDIVSTESAYFLGERVTGRPKYLALNSSCDLVPNRRKYASLLRISVIRKTEENVKTKLDLLLRFKKRESMYLPVLPVDDEAVACNAVQFDGVCQIRSGDLLLAGRIASLSLVGWRIFGSFSRVVIARATEREVAMRLAVESQPTQAELDLQTNL